MRFIGRLVLVGVCVIATGGCTLYSWGDNGFAQLGDGTTKTRLDPVPAARNPDWIEVDAGFYDSCGIDQNNALYCWGNNTSGELGLGTSGSTRVEVPTRVGTSNGWTAISAGGAGGSQEFTCGIQAGALLCWGWNQEGELGLGDTNARVTPTRVGTATDWKQVSAGGFAACGIRAGGALFCWGDGDVGDGTNGPHLTPVRIGTATDWSVVESGYDDICGIRTNGTLFCWGDNDEGQIGDGTIGIANERTEPTQVGTSTGWTAVGPGDGDACAIRSGGMYCWGNNSYGQVGIGTIDNPEGLDGYPTPTRVGTASDWTSVAGGEGAACGIRAQTLYCWGDGFSSPTGDGTTEVRPAPTLVPFGKWLTISIGGRHKLGLRNLG